MYTVYMLVFPNNKKYVGVTARSCEERWKKGHGYANNKELYREIKKYGWEKIEKISLKSEIEKEEAFKLEQHYIKNTIQQIKDLDITNQLAERLAPWGFTTPRKPKRK